MSSTELLTEEPPKGKSKIRGERLFTNPVGGATKRARGVEDEGDEQTDLSGIIILGRGRRRIGPKGLNSDGYPAREEF